MNLRPGDRLGDWVVDGQLGEGGMGAVYRCHSVLADDVLAAVKVLKESRLGDSVERFVQELRTLSSLSHPAIVGVQGGGRDEERGLVYMAMELVDGEDLADRLARGPMAPDEARAVFGPVADALAYAHQRGVAHRDIKPANIMLRHDGSPVIVDFGIAVAEDRTRMTAEGLVPGTMAYLPPEIFEGETPEPRSTDAYATGVVMWEALTGESAFAADPSSSEGQQMAQVMGLKLRTEALDPGTSAPDPVREAVRRTTDPDPTSRLIDLAAVRDLLTTGQVAAPARQGTRGRGCGIAVAALLALAVGGLVLLAALVGGLWWWGAPSPSGDRPRVDLAETLQQAATQLEAGEAAEARRLAGLALDDHPDEPYANLLYGQALLADGQGRLARPYLCAAAAAGPSSQVPGLASGDLDCTRGPGAKVPLSAPLAVARVDLSEEIAAVGADRGEAVADAGGAPPPAAPAPRPRPTRSRSARRDAGAPSAPEPPPAPPAAGAPPPAAEAPAPEPVAPEIRLASVEVVGELDRDTVEAVIRRSLARLERCYADALSADPSRAGRVVLELSVGSDGAVGEVRAVEGSGSDALDACLAATVRALRFSAAEGGASTVTVGLERSPG